MNYGHFLVAKLFNVKIKQFAIGFGPTIWKKQGKETSYELKAIPMGGFVNMLGEDEPVEDQRAYNQKTIPQKDSNITSRRHSKHNLWANFMCNNSIKHTWV